MDCNASATSVARSIEILRAERWLTLCERIIRGKRPTGATVHALHDKPLPDTLYLDPEYYPFLLYCEASEHPRIWRAPLSLALVVAATRAPSDESATLKNCESTLGCGSSKMPTLPSAVSS